jgi:DNA recombination protein RmuC
MDMLWASLAAMVAAGVGFFVGRSLAQAKSAQSLGQLQGEQSRTLAELATLRDELTRRETRIDQLQAEVTSRREELANLTATLEQRERNFAEQKMQFDAARQQLQETFKALAMDSLKSSNTSFIELAKETLAGVMNQAKGDLTQQKEQMTLLLKPLAESLQRYEKQLTDIEKSRQEAYGSLHKHLQVLNETQSQLQDRTSKLTMALRNPQSRGRWGELTLQRAVEIAGLTEYCDFDTQVSSDTDAGRQRPDMIVRLPGGRRIVIDAKVPCDDYLNAIDATDETQRRAAMERYATAVKGHARQLGAKAYWEQYGNDSPEFVVLFLPGESFFSAAWSVNHELIEQAMQNRVILASPTTLIALLRAVAFGWRQEQLAQSAQEIRDVCQDLYDRVLTFAGHLGNVGKHVGNLVRDYNQAVGSYQTRIQPGVRKLTGLGLSAKKGIDDLPTIDTLPRDLPESADVADRRTDLFDHQ